MKDPRLFRIRRRENGQATDDFLPEWRYQYTDRDGKRRTATGTASYRDTKIIARNVQERERMVREGAVPAATHSPVVPVRQVASEYLKWGAHKGGKGGRPWSPEHHRVTALRLDFWLKNLEVNTTADLEQKSSLAKAERVLDEYEAGHSKTTLNALIQTLKGFVSWAEQRGYLNGNPFRHLTRYHNEPVRQRRALTQSELSALLNECRSKYRLMYELATYTGFRVAELRALRMRNFDGKSLYLSGDHTKNRREARQPLPDFLAWKLKEYVKDKKPESPLLKIPSKPAECLRGDLKRAGIEFETEEGRVDFHSLRVTYVTMLANSGATVGEMQALARHRSPSLTLNTYTRTSRDSLQARVSGMGG